MFGLAHERSVSAARITQRAALRVSSGARPGTVAVPPKATVCCIAREVTQSTISDQDLFRPHLRHFGYHHGSAFMGIMALRTHSINRPATGLSVRSLSVTIATGHGGAGSLIGNCFNAKRWR